MRNWRTLTPRFEALVAEDPIVKRLTTCPSIGPITATAFVAALDDVHRFDGRAAHPVTSYLGLVPREYSSGETTARSVMRSAHPYVQRCWSKPPGASVDQPTFVRLRCGDGLRPSRVGVGGILRSSPWRAAWLAFCSRCGAMESIISRTAFDRIVETRPQPSRRPRH